MIRTKRTRALAAATVAGLIAGGSLLSATPAFAAPGDASALGLGVDIDAGVLALLAASVDATVGEVAVTGAGTDSSELVGADASIAGSLLASASATAVNTSATSSNTGSAATAAVDGLSVNILGFEDAIAANGTLTAAAICPVGAAPSAETDFLGLTVLGQDIGVDELGAETTVALGGQFTGLDLTISVDNVETSDGDSSLATALVADIAITGSLLAIPVVDIDGSVTIASAECERPIVALVADAIAPAAGPTAGGQTVTITGEGFGPDTTVTFDGTPATGLVIDPTGRSLVATTPVGDLGPATVVVTTGDATAELAYEYLAPTVTGLEPGSGSEDGGDTVTIGGSGLGDTTTVTFGDEEADIVSVSDTAVVVTTPAGTGTVPVTVGSSTGVEVDAGDFEYVAPSILGFTPTGGPEAGGTLVVISGDGLGEADVVRFGTGVALILDVSEDGDEVTVVTPAGVGVVPVTIELTDGRVITAPGTFRYIADEDRVVTDIDPRQGPAAGGQEVTITGDALNDVTEVTFDGATAPIVSVSEDGTEVVVITPAGEAGFVDVELTFSDDEVIDGGQYLYVDDASPVVDSITPATGPTAGGTTVVIVGDNLGGVTEVTFGGTPGTIVGTPTDTSITVITPAGPAGFVDVVLTGDDGSALVEDGFTYVSPITPGGGGNGNGGAVVSGAAGGPLLASTGVDAPILPLTIGALLALLAGAAIMRFRTREA